MSITYNAKIPADGNPDGIVDAPKGALFHKNGAFYKVNKSGSGATTWESVYFKAYSGPNYYLTDADMQLLLASTGSYLYTKNTIEGTPYGWAFLSNLSPNAPRYANVAPSPTPTPTPTPAPTATPTPTPTASYLEFYHNGSPIVEYSSNQLATASLTPSDVPYTYVVTITNPLSNPDTASFGPPSVFQTPDDNSFNVDNLPWPDIAPGESTQATYSFNPNSGTGTYAAELSISYFGVDGNPFWFSVTASYTGI